MSDSYELAILIIVSVILFVMVVYIFWCAMRKHGGVNIWDPTDPPDDPPHKFMTDRNLFRKKEKEE